VVEIRVVFLNQGIDFFACFGNPLCWVGLQPGGWKRPDTGAAGVAGDAGVAEVVEVETVEAVEAVEVAAEEMAVVQVEQKQLVERHLAFVHRDSKEAFLDLLAQAAAEAWRELATDPREQLDQCRLELVPEALSEGSHLQLEPELGLVVEEHLEE
jgi:hypothetical protein